MRYSKFPQKLLDKHPDLTKNQIKAIAKVVLNSRSNRTRVAYILDFTIPYLGRFWTRSNKTVRRKRKALSADRKRKKLIQIEKQMSKEKLLW